MEAAGGDDPEAAPTRSGSVTTDRHLSRAAAAIADGAAFADATGDESPRDGGGSVFSWTTRSGIHRISVVRVRRLLSSPSRLP